MSLRTRWAGVLAGALSTVALSAVALSAVALSAVALLAVAPQAMAADTSASVPMRFMGMSRMFCSIIGRTASG